jgi:hypothetical protein
VAHSPRRALDLTGPIAAFVVLSLVAVLVTGIPLVADRRDRSARVGAIGADDAAALTGLGRRLDREGRLTAWYVAGADPASRTSMAAARVATDRSARRLASRSEDEPVIRPVLRRWRDLGIARATFDRRIASDVDVLNRFRGLGEAVVTATGGDGRAADPAIGRGGRRRTRWARAGVIAADIDRTMVVATARGRAAPELFARVRSAQRELVGLGSRDPALRRAAETPRAVEEILLAADRIGTRAWLATAEDWLAGLAVGHARAASAATRAADGAREASEAAAIRAALLVGSALALLAGFGTVLVLAARRGSHAHAEGPDRTRTAGDAPAVPAPVRVPVPVSARERAAARGTPAAPTPDSGTGPTVTNPTPTGAEVRFRRVPTRPRAPAVDPDPANATDRGTTRDG